MTSTLRYMTAAAGLGIVLFSLPAPAKDAKPRTISDGERAAASWAVQNLVSRHDYLHAVERNVEELETDWVSPAGQFASTATFSSPDWSLLGMDTIVRNYGNVTEQGTKRALSRLAEVDPSVKVSDENYGAGSAVYLHTNTTPIIEIASDGKTAQGVWYTPGMDINPIMQDGKILLRASMSYQKLAGDFVKENGQWKIWHLLTAFDFSPPLPEEMLKPVADKLGELYSREAPKPAGPPGGAGGIPSSYKLDYVYPRYTPQRPGVVFPYLPKPYHSFAEVVSNCNCRQDLPASLK